MQFRTVEEAGAACLIEEPYGKCNLNFVHLVASQFTSTNSTNPGQAGCLNKPNQTEPKRPHAESDDMHSCSRAPNASTSSEYDLWDDNKVEVSNIPPHVDSVSIRNGLSVVALVSFVS